MVLTRQAGGNNKVAYLHADALGSTDVVTDGAGAAGERRSYDAFGARRHPTWGQPPPAGGFTSKASPMGFTGHDGDDELGLINMRGRIYDPKLGRFLTTDPIVSRPHFGQSWNLRLLSRRAGLLRRVQRTPSAPRPAGRSAAGPQPA